MTTTRVLVVDDDKSVLRMIEYGLQRLGPEYEIFLAKDMEAAMRFIEQEQFDLIITDYMMPGLTGVDLARVVHRLSPSTQIVLMTAYGTEKLRYTSTHVGVDGYLDKPFDIEKIREIIRDANLNKTQGRPSASVPDMPKPPDNPVAEIKTEPLAPPTIGERLQALQINAGARAVLLINNQGEPLRVIGQLEKTKAANIAALVATNFFQATQLSTLLDNKRSFKSGFYEGDSYNVYVCDVNNTSLLAVIFDVKLRPGVVWFYTKQTATELAPLLT